MRIFSEIDGTSKHVNAEMQMLHLQQMKMFSMKPDGMYTLESFVEGNVYQKEKVARMFKDFLKELLVTSDCSRCL